MRENKKPYLEKLLNENTVLRGFSQNVDKSQLVWHRDAEHRKITVIEGRGWKFQRDNQLPQILNEGDTVTVKAGEYHRLIKGDTDLVVTIVKEEQKLTPKQMKIARAAPPEDAITGADFKALNKEKDEKPIDEKNKIKTDFDKDTGQPGYLRGRSEKDRKANQKLTRQLKRAKTQKAKEKIYDKINKQREKERNSMTESNVIRITDPEILREYLEEIIEEQKLYAALEEVHAIEEGDPLYEYTDYSDFGELDEKRKRKKRKKRKSSKSGKTLSKAVKKSLDKKADKRCLTRGSVYAEFRAGLGAYYTSGSRKGMSPHQWAHARVNSANPSKKWAKVKKRKKCPKKKKGKK